MSSVIYKYELQFDQHGVAHVYTPRGRCLKVALQGKKPHVWIEHDLANPKRRYSFRTMMTGEEMPADFSSQWSYFDTLFLDYLVIHIYEELAL